MKKERSESEFSWSSMFLQVEVLVLLHELGEDNVALDRDDQNNTCLVCVTKLLERARQQGIILQKFPSSIFHDLSSSHVPPITRGKKT